jgi:hypothetical protein
MEDIIKNSGNITEFVIGLSAIALVVFIMSIMTNAMSASNIYTNSTPKVETFSRPV